MSISLLNFRHHAGIITSLVLIIILGAASGFLTERAEASARRIASESIKRQTALAKVLPQYTALLKKMQMYMDEGVDTTEAQANRAEVLRLIAAYQYVEAESLINETLALLEVKKAEKTAADEVIRLATEREKGTLSGTVKAENTALSGVLVKITIGSATVGESTSDKLGKYTLAVKQGIYNLTASRSGYNTYSKTNVEIKAQLTATLDIALTKRTATPAPATSSGSSQSVDGATYENKTVSTSRGSFTVDMMTLDMGKVKMITDTASDSDCSNNCPTKSLASYVSANGGFAGINGTYFCPSDYADCAGKTNTFHWKILTTRLNKIINENNGLAENDPAIAWGNGQIKWYGTWNSFKSSGFGASGAINSRPRLVENGNNVLNDGDLDDKQRTVKSNRGGLGMNGNTMYAVVARSATVPDLAEIMRSLGAKYAMNIDGGGSSAIYFNGSYKAGPGRSLPNAVIFAAR